MVKSKINSAGQKIIYVWLDDERIFKVKNLPRGFGLVVFEVAGKVEKNNDDDELSVPVPDELKGFKDDDVKSADEWAELEFGKKKRK